MDEFGNILRSTQVQVARARFWERLFPLLLWGWFAAGAVILLGKFSVPAVTLVGLSAAGIVPLAGAAVSWSLTRRFSAVHAAVLLDRRAGLGGAPLMLLAHPRSGWDKEWVGRASECVPQISWTWRAKRSLPAFAFVAATLAVPQQEAIFEGLRVPHSAATLEVERLREHLEKMKENQAVAPEVVDRVKEELDALKKSAEDRSLGPQTWEGIDHVGEQMHRLAREQASKLETASSLAERLQEGLKEGAKEAQQRESLEALERAMMGIAPDGLPEGALEMTRRALGDGEPPDADELREAMGALREFLGDALEELEEEAERLHDHSDGD